MVFTALFTAVTCILAPLSITIPVSPVPVSLTILAIFLSVYALGMKYGTVSLLIYLLIGLVGVPVFSGFKGGPGVLLGPTGGYIIGFVFVAVISGLFIDRSGSKIYMHALGMIIGTAICYAFGTSWLAREAGLSFMQALFAGVIPFIPADAVKIVIALLVGPKIRRIIRAM